MTLYLPDRTVHYAEGSLWRQDGPRSAHLAVPVVPLINRGCTLETEGVSELVDIVPVRRGMQDRYRHDGCRRLPRHPRIVAPA